MNSLSTHINLRLQIPTSNLVTLSPAITLFKLHSFYSNKSELQKDHFKSKTNSYYSLLGNADDQSNFQTSTGSENQILKPTIQQILKTNNSTHSMHSTVVNGEIWNHVSDSTYSQRYREFKNCYIIFLLNDLYFQTVSAFKFVLSIKNHVGSTDFNCIFKLCRLSKSSCR